MAFFDPELKLRNTITVSGDTKDTFGSGPAESEDTVSEEGQDDGDFLLRVSPLL